jgi:hypothetical protein
MGASKFTREDLVRAEICWQIEDCLSIAFTPEEVSAWRTVGDIHQSLTAAIRAQYPGSTDAGAAWAWLRVVLAELYSLAIGQVEPDAALFDSPLVLVDRESAPWQEYYQRKASWRKAAAAVLGSRPALPEQS